MPNPASAYDAIIAAVLAAPGPAGPAEAAMAQVVAGAVPAPASPAAVFAFPGDKEILAELTTSAANWPVVIKHHIDTFVLPQFQAIPNTAVRSTPASAGTASWNTLAQLGVVSRYYGDVPWTAPATNGFPKSIVQRRDYKLHQLHGVSSHDIVRGLQLVTAYVDGGNSVPAAAYASRAAALESIKNLAAFEGLCIRMASAVRAVERSDVSLSETLAMWRTEGDLLVPYSERRRKAGAPTCDSIADLSLATKNEVLPSMSQGLWSFTYRKMLPGPIPTDPADRALVVEAFRMTAFMQWWVATAGVDLFMGAIAFDLADRVATVDAIATFLDANRRARGGASSKPVLVTACSDVLDTLEVTLPAAPAGRVIVAPKDPSKLISFLLGEALVFSELNSAGGKGPVIEPTRSLRYLAYHCQDRRHPTDPAQDKFTLMVVSAAVAAARGPAGALKASLAPVVANLPASAALKKPLFNSDGIHGDTTAFVTAYQKLKDAGWWTPANLELLAQFMVTATNEWAEWEEMRGNMARYVTLETYYEALLG